MALYPELEKIRDRLTRKLTLSDKERALLSELKILDGQLKRRMVEDASIRVTKMTGPDDGKCACCGR